jgi:hypothetical protein
MSDRRTVEIEPPASAGGTPVPGELQARLARAYLSGNGAEVERVLALIAEANYVLPPKTSRAA